MAGIDLPGQDEDHIAGPAGPIDGLDDGGEVAGAVDEGLHHRAAQDGRHRRVEIAGFQGSEIGHQREGTTSCS